MMISLLFVSSMLAAPAAELPACVGEVNKVLQGADYPAVIAAAERCEGATSHPRNRYYSGVARIALGQHTRAILDLLRYLRSSATEPERLVEIATGRLAQARSETGALLLRVAPAKATIQVEVRPVDGDEAPFTASLEELMVGDGGAVLWLAPGQQRITIRDGQATTTREISVTAGMPIAELELSLLPVAALPPPRPPAPARDPFPRRQWLAQTGILGATGVVAGLALLPVGRARSTRQLDLPDDACRPAAPLDRCRDGLAEGTTLRGASAGLLGAGLGVLAGGLTGLVGTGRARRIAWSVETGLGGALAVVGAAVLGVRLRGFNRVNTDTDADHAQWDPTYKDEAQRYARGYAVGAGLLGVGVGLGVSAVTGLVVQRFTSRVQVNPQGLAFRF